MYAIRSYYDNAPYAYDDIDEKGLCVHNLTFLPSSSIAFNIIINIISKPGDVVLVTRITSYNVCYTKLLR